jgi:hypothetical protein
VGLRLRRDRIRSLETEPCGGNVEQYAAILRLHVQIDEFDHPRPPAAAAFFRRRLCRELTTIDHGITHQIFSM